MLNLENVKIIEFYRANDPEHGFLSNLYKKPIIFENREFSCGEYAYQFGKYRDEDTKEWAMQCPKPHLLAILSHNLLGWDIVPHWKDIKVPRMKAVLKVKFQDPELREKLLATGDSRLVENSKIDSFWGKGKSGKGKNMLGKLLMKVREEINKSEV